MRCELNPIGRLCGAGWVNEDACLLYCQLSVTYTRTRTHPTFGLPAKPGLSM